MKDKRDERPRAGTGEKIAGHWILPGDWIIRCGPTEDDTFKDSFDNPFAGLSQTKAPDWALTDRCVYVLDVTKTHIVVYDPISGKPMILQLSHFPGDWYLATKRQYDVTWDMATALRPREHTHTIPMEREKYQYKGRGNAR